MLLDRTLTLCCLLTCALSALTSAVESEQADRIIWPDSQVLPHFPTSAESLDMIAVETLSPDEQLTFVALQGQVNKVRPRIWLDNRRRNRGGDIWFRTLQLQVGKTFNNNNKHELIEKYASTLRGIVLYEPGHNAHMRNLAATVAGCRNSLPVTPSVHKWLQEHNINLPVVADLTTLELNTAAEVYEYLHKEYWPECEKRFIVSARPAGRGGDYHHTRDLAAACGAATVWLDCREPNERALFGKFLADMPAGNAVVLGWYTSERSGVTTATAYGIGTMAADHFMNSTVLSGGDHTIQVPQTPLKPKLENKLYVTVFISDGDNIQYTQNAMRQIWDRSSESRGKFPLNWTIAPGLVDIAPDILNYYYKTATPNDCFVCGPSGMGYTMPVNTLTEPGAPLGSTLDDKSRMDSYARLTSNYLKKAGLRVLTIWDNATPMQRSAYERCCQELLGATVQNFRDDPSVDSSVENDRLRFERLVIPYTTTYRHLRTSLEQERERWDGNAPYFVAYQANIWKELQPERLVEFMGEMQERFPRIEFVRADHYFQLQEEARLRFETSHSQRVTRKMDFASSFQIPFTHGYTFAAKK